MDKHIFMYQIKVLLRKRTLLFWNLMFPIILGTLFYFAFSNTNKAQFFSSIPVAVVYEKGADQNFKTVLEAVSKSDNNKQNAGTSEQLFSLHIVSDEKEAKELLSGGKIEGYILAGTAEKLVIKENGYNQTIIKSFLDRYLQRSAIIQDIMTESNGQADAQKISDVLGMSNRVQALDFAKGKVDYILIAFYSLLAMGAMNGSSMGIHMIAKLQANQSTKAARSNMGPISKHKLFFSNLAALYLISIIMNAIIFLYVHFALHVSFGNDYLHILITLFLSVLTGISFGTAIGCIVKEKESVKISISTSLIMLGAFLSGMMSVGIKYEVQQHAPLLAKINPLNLITDAYYAVYYYKTYTRFWENIATLTLITVLFLGITIIVYRRQQYESL